MQGLCGLFEVALLPEWLAKMGPAIAAGVAVLIYGLGRYHARNDRTAKREILHAMLQEAMEDAGQHVTRLNKQLATIVADSHPADFFVASNGTEYRFPSIDRLNELQVKLIDVGSKEDAAVAAFIESCRRFESRLTNCIVAARAVVDANSMIRFKRDTLAALHDAAAVAMERSAPAMEALKKK